jgi:hypothetical protein
VPPHAQFHVFEFRLEAGPGERFADRDRAWRRVDELLIRRGSHLSFEFLVPLHSHALLKRGVRIAALQRIGVFL